MRTYKLNILTYSSGAVTHGVEVFAEVERFLFVFVLACDVTKTTGRVGIHFASDIHKISVTGHAPFTLIVNVGFRHTRKNVFTHGVLVSAAAGFVAKRPHNDAASVFITFKQLLCSVYVRLFPK